MRDIHSHILPGVDDGARDLEESLAMLSAARAAGVTSIVCTPHCRDPYFDYEAMCAAFDQLKAAANGFDLTLGFEVYHDKLLDLGFDWVDRLRFEGSNEFLLEFSPAASSVEFRAYQRTIFELQARGCRVIVAHPERYRLVRQDTRYALELIDMGCELQASADFLKGGRFGLEKRPAMRLLKEGLYTHIASDAHCAEHYAVLGAALSKRAVRAAFDA